MSEKLQIAARNKPLLRWLRAYSQDPQKRTPPPCGWYRFLRDGFSIGHTEWAARFRLYQQSEAWRVFRAQQLQLTGGRCVWCATTTTVEVYHVTYRYAGRERRDSVRVVCAACRAAKPLDADTPLDVDTQPVRKHRPVETSRQYVQALRERLQRQVVAPSEVRSEGDWHVPAEFADKPAQGWQRYLHWRGKGVVTGWVERHCQYRRSESWAVRQAAARLEAGECCTRCGEAGLLRPHDPKPHIPSGEIRVWCQPCVDRWFRDQWKLTARGSKQQRLLRLMHVLAVAVGDTTEVVPHGEGVGAVVSAGVGL